MGPIDRTLPLAEQKSPSSSPSALLHVLPSDTARKQGAFLQEELTQRGIRCDVAPSLGDSGDFQLAANSLDALDKGHAHAILISCGREEMAGIAYAFDDSLDPGERTAAMARAFRTTELVSKRIEFWNAARQSKRFFIILHSSESDPSFLPHALQGKQVFFAGRSADLDRLARLITELKSDTTVDWRWTPRVPLSAASPAQPPAPPSSTKTPSPPDSISISSLSSFVLAPSAQAILSRAKAMTPPGGRFSTLAALAFLFAFKEIGRESGEPNTTIQFVHRYIDREAGSAYENVYRTTVKAWSDDSPADIRVEPPAGSWVKTITPNVQRLFARAQQIAVSVWVDDSNVDPSSKPARAFSRLPITIHARHLFAALLTFEPAPGSPNNVIEKLNGLKIDLAALRAALFEVIVANTPEENAEAWRQVLQLPSEPRTETVTRDDVRQTHHIESGQTPDWNQDTLTSNLIANDEAGPDQSALAGDESNTEVQRAPGGRRRIKELTAEHHLSMLAARLIDRAAAIAATFSSSAIASTRALTIAYWTGVGSPAPDGIHQWFRRQFEDTNARAAVLKHYTRLDTALGDARVEVCTADFARVIDLAARIAQACTGDRRIDATHILAALLIYEPEEPTNAAKMLIEMGIPARELRTAWVNDSSAWPRRGSTETWRAILEQGEPYLDRRGGVTTLPNDPAEPDGPDDLLGPDDTGTDQADLSAFPLSYLSPFDNDQNTVDKLNLEHEIDALAYLIAANTVKPPLAIGLFGEWGSGKSFFMDRLRERVHRVARRARAGDRLHRIQTAASRKITADPAKISFHRHICQIQFNAWHYVEGNIWASLVENIFSNLQAALIDPKAEAEERLRQQNELKKQLGFAQQARADLEAKLITLNAAREKANTVVETARRDHTDNSVALGKAIAKDIWSDVAFSDKDNPGKLRASLIEAGFPESALDTPRELYDVVQSLRTTGGWFRAQFALIAGARGSGKGLFIFIAASALAIAIALGLWAIQTGALAGIIAIITQVTGLIAGVVAWLRTQAKRMADLQRTAEPVFKSIEAKLAAATQARAQLIAMLEKSAEQSNALFLQAKAQLDQVDQEIAKIQAQIKSQAAEPDATKVLAQFIEERAACTDYRRHLGITAIVRRDFEKLAGLIASRSISTPGKDGPRSIDRIVLYIDDLDRCPPDKVVAVLEAIHLILAFKLFVVVVGVDARWVSHSLRDRYGSLLSGRGRADTAHRPADAAAQGEASITPAAVPEDYLEKIFQVPFRLRSLTREGTESLIDHLTGYARAKDADLDPSEEAAPLAQQQATAPPPPTPAETPKPHIETKPTETARKPERPAEVGAGVLRSPPNAAAHASSNAGSPVGTTPAPIPASIPTPAAAASPTLPSSSAASSVPPSAAPAAPQSPPASAPAESASTIPSGMVPLFPRQTVIREIKAPNLSPGTLELTDTEIDLMISLAPVIGRSPRAVNRFVNCYRLLKAARDPNDIAAFAAASKNRAIAPPYEASMLLLAIVIGAPEIASPVLSHLARGLGTPMPSDPSKPVAPESELKRMLDTWANDRQINAEPDWKTRIKPFFDDYLARKLKAGDPCSIQPLCDAVASVARYSFRTGMMEDIDTLLSSRPKRPIAHRADSR